MVISNGTRAALTALSLVVPGFAQEAGRAGALEPAFEGSYPASRIERSELRPASPPLARRVIPLLRADEHGSIERFLNDRVEYWCKRLKLEDWRVALVTTRRESLRAKTLGKIQWDKKRKSAVIEVMDPADYRLAFQAMLDDMEFTVVHELVHLSLASLPRSEASRSSEEDAVNRLAEALFGFESRSREQASAANPATAALRPADTK